MFLLKQSYEKMCKYVSVVTILSYTLIFRLWDTFTSKQKDLTAHHVAVSLHAVKYRGVAKIRLLLCVLVVTILANFEYNSKTLAST